MSLLDHLAAWFKAPAPAREHPGAPTAPGQVNPLAHLGGQAPAAMAGITYTGADYDHVAQRPAPSRADRAWRVPISSPTPATNDDPRLTGTRAEAAVVHESHGEPDTRRGTADHAAGPVAPFRPLEDTTVNVRRPVVVDHEAAPNRTRGGWTGEDPARPASSQTAWTVRPFDKGIADHPGAVTKAGQPAPLAHQPNTRGRLLGGRPSPGGSSPDVMVPVGGQPNTQRTVPTPWDTHLTNARTEAPSSTARAGGWRAR